MGALQDASCLIETLEVGVFVDVIQVRMNEFGGLPGLFEVVMVADLAVEVEVSLGKIGFDGFGLENRGGIKAETLDNGVRHERVLLFWMKIVIT